MAMAVALAGETLVCGGMLSSGALVSAVALAGLATRVRRMMGAVLGNEPRSITGMDLGLSSGLLSSGVLVSAAAAGRRWRAGRCSCF